MQISKKLVQNDFDKAAHEYHRYSNLQKKVASLLCKKAAARFDKDAAVLDIGSGTGFLAAWKKFKVIQIDISFEMCRASSAYAPAINGDMEIMPFKNSSFGNLYSSLALQWANDRNKVFAEIHRVMKNNGKCLIATFGPETLREMKRTIRKVSGKEHVIAFPDMEIIRQEMANAGFKEIEIEIIRFHRFYESVFDLMKKIKGVGGNNKNEERGNPLTKSDLIQIEKNYEFDKDKLTILQRIISAIRKIFLKRSVVATWEVYFISAIR